MRVGEWKVEKWGSKLSYQKVRIMLVYIEVLQKRHKPEWGKIYLEVSIWRQRIGFPVCKMLHAYIYNFWREIEKAFNKFSKGPTSAKVSALQLE